MHIRELGALPARASMHIPELRAMDRLVMQLGRITMEGRAIPGALDAAEAHQRGTFRP
jgi:hypothetical protein